MKCGKEQKYVTSLATLWLQFVGDIITLLHKNANSDYSDDQECYCTSLQLVYWDKCMFLHGCILIFWLVWITCTKTSNYNVGTLINVITYSLTTHHIPIVTWVTSILLHYA